MDPVKDREFDIVAFGATGFVGGLIAEELGRLRGGPRIALAGRDVARLVEVCARVGVRDHIVADAFDPGALARLAARTRVVLSTVGPYSKYGHDVVAACVARGTHYVDLNGEVAFARHVIDAHDAAARAAGISVVLSCGFDSVPADLGVLLAAQAARDAGAGELLGTTAHVRELVGGLSGVTIDALRTQIDSARGRRGQRDWSASDPYALSPDRDAEPEPRGTFRGGVILEVAAVTGEFAVPFLMARYNQQIVARSNALLGWRYGRGLRYREEWDTGRGALGAARAVGLLGALGVAGAALRARALRPVTNRVLPAPGEGPGERARARGRFRYEVHAQTTGSAPVVSTVAARRDPGYGGTAVMIAQGALALAAGEALDSGVSTPAVALGLPYAQRLREQGFELTARVEG